MGSVSLAVSHPPDKKIKTGEHYIISNCVYHCTLKSYYMMIETLITWLGSFSLLKVSHSHIVSIVVHFIKFIFVSTNGALLD